MKFQPVKTIISFLIILVITALAVHFLSVVTRIDNLTSAQTITVEAAAQPEEAELSAVIVERSEFNFIALLAFLLIVFGTLFGVLLYFRAKAKNPNRVLIEGQKYNPKKENMFKNPYEERRRRRAANRASEQRTARRTAARSR